jgi:hypothetical protein
MKLMLAQFVKLVIHQGVCLASQQPRRVVP